MGSNLCSKNVRSSELLCPKDGGDNRQEYSGASEPVSSKAVSWWGIQQLWETSSLKIVEPPCPS
ncbi:unnamed protein product [Linum tenue]|uniref:Uncharacterized protein n=1 Tax=Linum tenue TaxID=586396 RepID=A0AAV0H8Z8_9ROSI|nr:unnamed protein product [Linum tenue]